MADDDEQVEVGEIAVVWLVDPVRARIAAEQNDLQDLTALAPLRRAAGALTQGGLEFGQQGRADVRELLLLTLRQMVEGRLHQVSLARLRLGASADEDHRLRQKVRRALRTCEMTRAHAFSRSLDIRMGRTGRVRE